MALEVKKLYYSIGEVSEITGLKPYVLRYWESEFSNLAPSKNPAGNRAYTQKDINILLDIIISYTVQLCILHTLPHHAVRKCRTR